MASLSAKLWSKSRVSSAFMKRYTTLLFDIDDTLIQERFSVIHGLEQVSVAQGATYHDTDFARWGELELDFWNRHRAGQIEVPAVYCDGGLDDYGRNRGEWLRAQRFIELFSADAVTLARAYELLDIFEMALRKKVVPAENLLSTLDYLAAKYTLLAVTDGVHDIAEHKLQRAGIANHFAAVFSPLNTGVIKPKPDMLTPVFSHFGADPRQYLLIGNSLSADIQLASNVGIDSCLYDTWGEAGLIDDLDPKPTFVIHNLSELRQFL